MQFPNSVGYYLGRCIYLGYICLDAVFAISLHYVALVNDSASAGLGLAFTIVSIVIMPLGFGLNQSMNVHVA
jgi:MATE family multidrug resistance protein